ncbi:MAG: aspartate aminotransferase family protein [Chloroflexi bacterium]|nr:aspartate aminotransferase family protein [Chloroflexota bacterium]
MSSFLERYEELHPNSRDLYERAKKFLPDGVTHDNRRQLPFPIYVGRALGSKKWDVDRNEYIDYVVGHGALLLGHSRPEIVAAVSNQMTKGTHYGASSALEMHWASWVNRLVPSAEKVRFFSSGTEATLMAIRLARAYTGKDKLLRFEDHFDGWHDYTCHVHMEPGKAPEAPGVPAASLSTVTIVPQNDATLVDKTLSSGEFAALILEPTGPSWGLVPIKDGFLADLREITRRHNVVLIFDEVITGFRVAVGGAQEFYNVKPDLTTLGKCVAGGLPGAAVAGRADIMAMIEFRDDERWNSTRRIAHPGTFNANPLSAAAGVTGLQILSSGKEQETANALGARLRKRLNDVLDRLGIPGCVYGDFSMFKFFVTRECSQRGCDRSACTVTAEDIRKAGARTGGLSAEAARNFRWGMLNAGIDFMGSRGGMLSSAHTEEDIDRTIAAFEEVLGELQREGLLK